jgi:hypothetical protein
MTTKLSHEQANRMNPYFKLGRSLILLAALIAITFLLDLIGLFILLGRNPQYISRYSQIIDCTTHSLYALVWGYIAFYTWKRIHSVSLLAIGISAIRIIAAITGLVNLISSNIHYFEYDRTFLLFVRILEVLTWGFLRMFFVNSHILEPSLIRNFSIVFTTSIILLIAVDFYWFLYYIFDLSDLLLHSNILDYANIVLLVVYYIVSFALFVGLNFVGYRIQEIQASSDKNEHFEVQPK